MRRGREEDLRTNIGRLKRVRQAADEKWCEAERGATDRFARIWQAEEEGHSRSEELQARIKRERVFASPEKSATKDKASGPGSVEGHAITFAAESDNEQSRPASGAGNYTISSTPLTATGLGTLATTQTVGVPVDCLAQTIAANSTKGICSNRTETVYR